MLNPVAIGNHCHTWSKQCNSGGSDSGHLHDLNMKHQQAFSAVHFVAPAEGLTSGDCCCSESDLKRYIDNAVEVDPDRPVLVDKYMDRADELDVDALADKEGNVTICGIMQHIEQAGVHSGALLLAFITFSRHPPCSPQLPHPPHLPSLPCCMGSYVMNLHGVVCAQYVPAAGAHAQCHAVLSLLYFGVDQVSCRLASSLLQPLPVMSFVCTPV